MVPNIYAVVFTRGSMKGYSFIEENYKDCHKIHDDVILIASNDASNVIAKASGLTLEGNDQEVQGMVFKLDTSCIIDFYPSEVLAWLEQMTNL